MENLIKLRKQHGKTGDTERGRKLSPVPWRTSGLEKPGGHDRYPWGSANHHRNLFWHRQFPDCLSANSTQTALCLHHKRRSDKLRRSGQQHLRSAVYAGRRRNRCRALYIFGGRRISDQFGNGKTLRQYTDYEQWVSVQPKR